MTVLYDDNEVRIVLNNAGFSVEYLDGSEVYAVGQSDTDDSRWKCCVQLAKMIKHAVEIGRKLERDVSGVEEEDE